MDSGSDDSGDQSYVPGKPDSVKKKIVSKKGKGKKISKAKAAKAQNKTPVKSACLNCRKSKVACDDTRPCKRCIRRGQEASCIDVKHKKRGRKTAGNADDDEADTPQARPSANKSKRQKAAPSRYREDDVEHSTGGKYRPGSRRPETSDGEEDDDAGDEDEDEDQEDRGDDDGDGESDGDAEENDADPDAEEEAAAPDADADTSNEMPQAPPRSGRRSSIPLLIEAIGMDGSGIGPGAGGKLHGSSSLDSIHRSVTPHATNEDDGHDSKSRLNGSLASQMLSPSDHFGLGKRRRPSDPNLLAYTSSTGRRLSRASVLSPNHLDEHNGDLVITNKAWDLEDESHFLEHEKDLSHDLPPDFSAARRQSVESIFPMGRRGSLSHAFKFPPHARFANRSGSLTGLIGPSPTPTSPTPHTSTSPSPRHIRSPSPGHSLLPASSQHDPSHNSNLLHPPSNMGANALRSPGAVTHTAAHALGIPSQHQSAVMAAVPVGGHAQPNSVQAANVLPQFAVPSGRVTPTWPAVTPATVLRSVPGVAMATPVPANIRQVRFSTVVSASDGTHHMPTSVAPQPRPVMAAIPVQLSPSPGASNLYTPIPKKSPSPGIAVATPVSAVPIAVTPPSAQDNPYSAALSSGRYAEPSPPPSKSANFKAPSNNAAVLHSPQRGKPSGSSNSAAANAGSGGPTHITHSIAPTITYSAVLPNALTNSATQGTSSNYATALPLPMSSSSASSGPLTPAQVRSLSPAVPPPPSTSASHSPSPFISSISPLSHAHSALPLPVPVQRAISPLPSSHAHNLLPSSFTGARSFSPLPRTISPLVRTISPVPNSGTSSDSHLHLLGSRAISPAPLGLLRGFSPVSHAHPLSPNSSLLRAVSPSMTQSSPAHSTSPILGAAKRRRSINTISEIQAVLGMTDLARAPSRSNTPSLDEKKPKEEKKEDVKNEQQAKPSPAPAVKIGSAFTPLASAASATLPSSLEISLPPSAGSSLSNGGPSSSPNTSSRSTSDGSTDSQVKSEHRASGGGGGGGGIVPSDSLSSLSSLSGGASPPSGFVSPSGGTSIYASFATASASDFTKASHSSVSVTVPNGHSNLSSGPSAPFPASSSGALSLKSDGVQPMDITHSATASSSPSAVGSLRADILAPLSGGRAPHQPSLSEGRPSLSAFSAAFASASSPPASVAYAFSSSSSSSFSSSATSSLPSFGSGSGSGSSEGGERVVLDTLLPADFGTHLSSQWRNASGSAGGLWSDESDNDNDCHFHDIDGSEVRPSPHSCCAMATTHAVSNHPMGLQREIAVMQQARARARRMATASPAYSNSSETDCSSAVSEEVTAMPKQMSTAPATALGTRQTMQSLEYLHYCSSILFEKLSQTQNVDSVPLPVLWFYRYFSRQFAYFLSEHPLSTLLGVVAESGAANQKTRDRVLRVLQDDYKHLDQMQEMIPPNTLVSTPVSSEFDEASNSKLQVEQRIYDDLPICALIYPLYPMPFERPPWINEHMASTLGYNRQELLKLLGSVTSFLSIFDSPTRITQDFQESIFRLRKHFTCRQTLVTKDGKHIHCVCSQRYTYLDDGTPFMLQCFYQPDPSARHPGDRPDTALERALKGQADTSHSS